MFIVTGASSGIGHATALALASRHVQVLAVARDEQRLRALRDQYPDQIHIVIADLATATGISDVLTAAKSHPNVGAEAGGVVGGMVHAAGTAVPLDSYQQLKLGSQNLQRHFAVHVEAPIALNNGLGAMLKGTRILYIDSFSANAPRIGWAAYSIIKAAARMAAQSADAELTDATVISVLPGGVRTPLVNQVLSATQHSPTTSAFQELEQAGKLVEPDAIGAYLCQLLLDATDAQLASRNIWTFGNPDDRIA
jgi:NAD(P)-dependent dehydrogenase (short-subunit alcohol dehydrogenase family)